VKILVIGSNGQMARALLDRGKCSGLEIVSLGRPQLDLLDADSIDRGILQHQPEILINAAAYTQVDQAERDEATAYAVNAEGAARVARACRARDIPLIHLSTDYVFDGSNARPYREIDAAGPVNVYGRSKLKGEQAVARICVRHLIVRTSWIFSTWGSNFVLTMLRLATKQATINVVNDQHGCPTYAPHLADALVTLARRAASDLGNMRWGLYHAAGQGETTWCDFAREIFANGKELGLPVASVMPIPTADYPTLAKRPLNSRLDCGELHAVHAIALPYWQAGVRDCVAQVAADRRFLNL
jgi:dTDP-4-dehydrorhamnose reductase